MTEQNIIIEQWYVKTLVNKIKNREIDKSKSQRKQTWHTLPKKNNVPSQKNYIKFLYTPFYISNAD